MEFRGEEPSHLRVAPPRQRSSDDQCLEIVLAMLRLCVLAWCLVGFRLVFALISAVMLGNPRTAKCWDKTLGVVALYSLCVRYCISGAVRVAGGSLEPSVPRSPQERRAAHGPRHPAMNIPLGLCRGLCQFVVRLFRSFFALMLRLFFLRGWYVVGCFALQAPTCVWITICVPFFSFCLVCLLMPFLCLSLSSSQALGKPKRV